MKNPILRFVLLLCAVFCGAGSHSAFAFWDAAPKPAAIVPNTEYIILSGGPSIYQWEKWKAQPHDIWWMNFVRAARIRIQELQTAGVPAEQITWLVYSPSYKSRAKQEGQDLLSNIATVREASGIKLKFFERTQEIFDYLNFGKPRDQIKIADFEYFGHSNKACWMFDYSNNIDSASKVWLHEDDFSKIQPGIFAKDAFAKSWGCHTGESMSQKFRRATGIKMWGAVGRSQYNTDELPTLASPTGKWKY
ncbi:MAG: hypothetical protein WCP06_03905 [Verrucomicrobiota bacterium]